MSTWLADRGAFESLYSASPNGIIALDESGRVIECNPAFALLSGYSRGDVVGRDARTLLGPSDAAFVDEAFAAAARGNSLRREVQAFRGDGTHMTVQLTSVPVVDSTADVRLFLLASDLTPMLKAEVSLASAQRDLREILANMPTPTIVFDVGQTVIDVNPAALDVTGYTREHCIGFLLNELVRPQSWEPVRTAFEAALLGGVGHARAHAINVEGGELLFDMALVPMYSGDSVVGVFALLENVTPQRQETDEVTQLRRNFGLLFDHNPAVVIAIDAEHRVTDVNPAGLQISGYRRDQVVGQNLAALVPPAQRERLNAFVDQTMRGETVTFDVEAYAADGRLIEYRATTLPVVSRNRVVGAYGLLENLTERLRAERTVAAQREELLDLEYEFRSLFDRNPDGMCLLSTDGTILDLNDSVVRIGGREREQVAGQNFRVFLQGYDLERAWSFFRRAVSGEPSNFEIASTRGDGSALELDMTLFPKYVQGVVVGVYAVFQDVTERKTAQRRLELQSQRIRDLYLLATAPEYTDAQITSTLQTGCRLLGMESGAIVEMAQAPRVEMRYDSLELFGGDDAQLVDLAKSVVDHREPVASYVGGESQSGYAAWIASRLVVNGALHGLLILFSRTRREAEFEEIDHDTLALMAALVGAALERRRTRTHLRTLAYYDSLTGLPNRLHFQEYLRDALLDSRGYAQPVAVLFFDLDRFKDINDTLGHAMGDRFLQMVAHRLVRSVGDDGVVARTGGDEFVVLLRNCHDTEQIKAYADKLLRTVDQTYRLDGYEQFMTTSIGVSIFPTDGRDDQTLIKNADIAMYRAKERGGNSYFLYHESLSRPLKTRLTQEKQLRRAIARDQLVLHYQPIIAVETQRITGVEALVRWQDPQRGLVHPDDFIGAAEASGLIVQLGEWVIDTSLRQVRAWQKHHANLALSVNISARQFHHPDLCRSLLSMLHAHDFPPGAVELEITESMALSDITHAIEMVRQLKEAGMLIAVDDFGTGHSSLSYLRRFDIDHIKIDRSFVAGIGLERSDETIVKAIIAMGHSLGLRIIAEGVETHDQYEFLKAHGCDRVQGYFFSRPVDATALERVLVARGNGAQGG